MENYSQSFDVCIVCALPEEVRAFLRVVKPYCDDNLEEHASPRYGYSYRSGALKNDKGELLTLHISWLPHYGPQEMALHLSHVLEECHPRIAIMTGICAGDSQRVQLGDLVVAERTFTYDNGKFVSDEQGRSIYRHDTLTYQPDANILQFLKLFDDWMPLVAGLETPLPMDRRKAVCHIKAMASGSAVRADNPFQDVQAPVRDTVAIDMEGAAFGLVMSRHPLTRWLIVKGVCDYADRAKNDAYHDYAACASASYALSFIRTYVSSERLPRPDGSSPSSRAGPSVAWNVPYGGTVILLVSLAFLVVLGTSAGVFYFTNLRGSTPISTSLCGSTPTRTNLQSPYLPFERLVVDDPLSNNCQGYNWGTFPPNDQGGACQFIRGAYDVKALNTINVLGNCMANKSFSNFAFEVEMTIIQGDCGGLLFRYQDINTPSTFYRFTVCQDGTYDLWDSFSYILRSHSFSAAIHTGFNQSNLIAVVANNDILDLYVNRRKVDSVHRNAHSKGEIGVVAAPTKGHPTEVVFSNAKVWTN